MSRNVLLTAYGRLGHKVPEGTRVTLAAPDGSMHKDDPDNDGPLTLMSREQLATFWGKPSRIVGPLSGAGTFLIQPEDDNETARFYYPGRFTLWEPGTSIPCLPPSPNESP